MKLKKIAYPGSNLYHYALLRKPTLGYLKKEIMTIKPCFPLYDNQPIKSTLILMKNWIKIDLILVKCNLLRIGVKAWLQEK